MKSSFLIARTVALATVLIATTACGDASTGPVTSVPSVTRPPGRTPPIDPTFPRLAHAGDIYVEVNDPYGDPDTQNYHFGTLVSRLVLYRDSTFAVQFSSARVGFFEYLGTYVRTDSTLAFTWLASSSAGPWEATARIRGDVISLQYSDAMTLSDFVNGDYALAR